MVGPPNLDKFIQSLATEGKKHQCTMVQSYANHNIIRQPISGSRDMSQQMHGWKVELAFACAEPSGCAEFKKYVIQEFERASTQVDGVPFPQGTDRGFHFTFLWFDQ